MLNAERIGIRIAMDAVLIVALFIVPWWVLAVMVGGSLFLYSWFFEGVLVMLLLDTVFAPAEFGWLAIATLLALLVVEGVTYYSRQ